MAFMVLIFEIFKTGIAIVLIGGLLFIFGMVVKRGLWDYFFKGQNIKELILGKDELTIWITDAFDKGYSEEEIADVLINERGYEEKIVFKKIVKVKQLNLQREVKNKTENGNRTRLQKLERKVSEVTGK